MDHPSNRITLDNVDSIFTFHNHPSKIPRYTAVRHLAKMLATTILRHCPDCADRSHALRQLREVVMTANAAIALEPNMDGMDSEA